MPQTQLDDRQVVHRAALSTSIGSAAGDTLKTILGLIDTKMVTLTGTQSLTNKTLDLLRTTVVTDSTTTGSAATLAAGDIAAGVTRLTNGSLASVSAIPAGTGGQFLTVENKTGNLITINNEDTGVTAANRILTGTGATVTMSSNASFQFLYDAVSSRWTLVGGTGGGGNLVVDDFTGDGSTTVFTLSVSPGSKNNTWVSISGVLQDKSTYNISGASLTFTVAPPNGDSIEVTSGTTLPIGTPSDGTVTRAKADVASLFPVPLITVYTSGSGTHTFTGSPTYVRVRMVGGGGGGAGSGSISSPGTDGTAGGQTSFGSSLLIAGGGNLGGAFGPGGSGGSATLGSGPTGLALQGGSGGSYQQQSTGDTAFLAGGSGGNSALGGGASGSAGGFTGGTGAANTGGGGGGAGDNVEVNGRSGAGGGAGGFVDAIIFGSTLTGLGGSAPYVVGAGGSHGVAGSGFNGGDGAAGIIEVTEYYQ